MCTAELESGWGQREIKTITPLRMLRLDSPLDLRLLSSAATFCVYPFQV